MIMMEMYDASYNDEPYDVVKWGKYFKPNNVSFDASGIIKQRYHNKYQLPKVLQMIPTLL